VQYDLGLVRTVAYVRVAAYQGNTRRNRFDIQLAGEDQVFHNVLTGAETSGTSTQEQTFDFPDADARYVRYVGHGNVGSTNPTMNSVTEVSLFALAGGSVTPTPTPGPSNITPGGGATSASTNDGNVPANTVDGSLSTRWSANGDGQWIQYDLGATRTVTSVSVAWYQGNTRVSTFDVQVADAPAGPFNTLAAGLKSNGTSLALQSHDVPDGAGRYVRLVGHGNTANAWNSITETQVWGR
jgi:poly(beta-D-mannuronate) lyase